MNPFRAALRYARARSAWLGSGGNPVPQPLANARATVCLSCPKNQPHPLYENLAAPIAAMLRRQIELKANMKLAVPDEARLHLCEACWCVMALKVWEPLEHAVPSTPLADLQRANPVCWILEETALADKPK